MENTIYKKMVIYCDFNKGIVHHGKLYYTQNGEEHVKRIESDEIDFYIQKIAEQKEIRKYEVYKSSLYQELDLKEEIKHEKEITKQNGKQQSYYNLYNYKIRNNYAVSKLSVRRDNITRILKKGVLFTLVTTTLFVGYRFYTENQRLSHTFIYHNSFGVTPIANNVINNSKKAENLIIRLNNNDYNGINKNDITFIKTFLNNVSIVNNDKNADFFSTYFSNICLDRMDQYGKKVISRIDSLQSSINLPEGYSERYIFNEENLKKYLIYTMTLVSGGEITYSYEPTIKRITVASVEDAYQYNIMSDINKLIILIPLRETILNTNIDFKSIGYNIYSFDSTNFNKNNFVDFINNKIDDITNNLLNNCGRKSNKI